MEDASPRAFDDQAGKHILPRPLLADGGKVIPLVSRPAGAWFGEKILVATPAT